MNKQDLIDHLASTNMLSKAEPKSALNLVFKSIADALAQGERMGIRDFGVFTVRNYKAYDGRNPKTGEIVKIRPKKLPYFKVGKNLKERVNNLP